MNKLFDYGYRISDFDNLVACTKNFILNEFKKNIAKITSSITDYRKYKKKTVSFGEIPSYKLNYEYKYIHSLNVAAKAVKLADCAKISEQIMYICGLLHDVGHYTCDVKSHGKKSAEMAMDFLRRNSDIPEVDIKKIAKIINSHCPVEWDEEYYKSDWISAEEIIMLEADFWDKNDLQSFIEKTGVSDVKILDSQYKKMHANCVELLVQKKEEQECEYTMGFKAYIKEVSCLSLEDFLLRGGRC